MRPAYGGQARTSADPPALPMSPDLVTDIASVSKTMTAMAMLQLLAKDGLPINTKISPYIYSDWTQGANISQLTFQELLTHSSGFGQLPAMPAATTSPTPPSRPSSPAVSPLPTSASRNMATATSRSCVS